MDVSRKTGILQKNNKEKVEPNRKIRNSGFH